MFYFNCNYYSALCIIVWNKKMSIEYLISQKKLQETIDQKKKTSFGGSKVHISLQNRPSEAATITEFGEASYKKIGDPALKYSLIKL